MRLHSFVFGLVVIAVSAAFLWVISPYAGAVLWSVIFAIMFIGMKERLSARFGGRDGLASLLTLLVIIALVIVPSMLLASLVLNEAVHAYQNVSASGVNLSGFIEKMLAAAPDWAKPLLQSAIGSGSEAVGTISRVLTGALSSLSSAALSLGQSAAALVIAFGVTLYLTYFLLRDGRSLAEKIATTVPLDRELYDALSERFVQVIRAMIKGSLVVAVAQGLIGGVVFALLGIPGAALWGTLMGAMSLIPAVGTGIVWVPVALYLLLTGSITEGLILIACGALIISTVDNVLRPILVGRETKMPDPLILISTLGGIAVAGFNGLIIRSRHRRHVHHRLEHGRQGGGSCPAQRVPLIDIVVSS
ncbi:MAG: AI-2E family transporter, partial [Sphingobium sp.]